ncbi:unnamed protein product [Lactuca virosa]|uniref:Uncharacterized protein n=1 Tax=Lactuca virosa TaxID=75947 RepID=A0AAU9PAX6_9ASTR|nr:unnamed protein product [Lactuca virosa]
MAKDQSSKSLARSSYEKISKVTFGSLRRISHCPKNTNIPNPSLTTTDAPQIPSLPLHQPVSGEALQNQIPCESIPPPVVKPTKKFVRFSSSNIKKTRDGDGGAGGKELTGQTTFSEQNVNGYIDRTKMKMRAPSNVSISRRESFNDKFSSYISRTKFRLRTTSTVGADGKTVSSG